jgi:AbrB family looped-hinge helix DNA binding protein
MSKVTAKLQITLPKAIADRFSIRPGDEIEWRTTRDAIHILPPGAQGRPLDVEQRLALFDQATLRQRERQAKRRSPAAKGRGWTRDELYDRPRSR